MKRGSLLLIALAAPLLAIIAIARVELVYHWQLAPILARQRAVQARHLELFKSDMNILKRELPFKRVVVGRSDAGVFLNQKLSWLPHSSDRDPHVIVRDEVRSDLVRYGNSYLDHPSHFTAYQTDLSFFSHLDGYDYWDIEHSSPIEKLMLENQFVPPANMPVPDPLDLIAAAKLRLIDSATSTRISQALRDVRELSRLLLTTENTQLITAGLSILEDERYAFDFYVRKGKLHRDDWTPLSQPVLQKARRAFDATQGYLQIWTKPAVFNEVFLKGDFPVGACSALNETIPATLTLRQYLEPQLPFELDFRQGYQALDAVIRAAKPKCRLFYVSKLIKEGNFPRHLPGIGVFNAAPYWRKLFALHASLANFSNFEAYEKLGVVSHQVFDEDINTRPATAGAPPVGTRPATVERSSATD